MNWKSYTEKLNAQTFILPSGWDSKDKVAEQLDCSVEKVDDHLRPAIKSGAVIKQQFKVWDDILKRNTMVWAYQETSNAGAISHPSSPALPLDITILKRMKAEGKTWQDMSDHFGRKAETIRSWYRVNR